MCFDNFLRSQFGEPSGVFGALFVAPVLNVANRRLMRRTVELLDPCPSDRVLDVGFGGGYSLMALAGRVTTGKVAGVDYSRQMVDQAAGLLRQRRLASRVHVQWGDVADLPFRARTFHRALTVNSLYYWPDIDAGFREIARVLKPRGRVAVGFRSPMNLRPFTWSWDNFQVYEPEEVAGILRRTGFHVVCVEHSDRWRIPDTVVVVGERD
jgi:ubiquinone/menaquinone biosynthesis C-methylase UbiE